MDKPLKLSERQMLMFATLARMEQTGQLRFKPREHGQQLPHSQWESYTATVDIWRSLVRRGVLTLVSGQAFAEWKVNPGPRFQEAIDLSLSTPGLCPEGSHSREALLTMAQDLQVPSVRKAPKP